VDPDVDWLLKGIDSLPGLDFLRVPQLKSSATPISPDEYDAVLRTRPEQCLPAAWGDFRTGRQLLSAAVADDAPLEALLQTRRGRAAIGHLAGVLDRAIRDLPPQPRLH
jgi:hypothetical protein